MSEKSSYESDISEGWSLIDINLNEESVNTSETQFLLESERDVQPDRANSKFKEATNLESTIPSKYKLNKEIESTFSGLNNFTFDEGPPNQDVLTNYQETLNEGKDTMMSEPTNDSCDVESIEILDVDGNYRDSDIDNLDVTAIDKHELEGSDHSSDKESLCEENQHYNTHHLTGIKRKRRKLSRDLESSAESSIGEIAISDGRYSCKTSNEDMKIQTCKLNKQHVYRHYRNNLANTVLSLSMGVIFAGVACIAIGHFLGVHDAEETAGELYDTLKKLQMENIALQSRLSQLNRALSTREVTSKLASSSNKLACDANSNMESTKSEGDHISKPGTHPHINSVEWLLKVHKLVQKGCINNEKVDVPKNTNYIHDFLTFLSYGKTEENKIQDLEAANAKFSKLLQKMMVKLSSSQDNLENLYSRFLKLKDKFNRKVSKFFPNLVDDFVCQEPEGDGFKSTMEINLPAVEKDLYSIQRNPVGRTTRSVTLTKKSKEDTDKRVSTYIFPQSEEYYLRERNNLSEQRNASLSMVLELSDRSNKDNKEIPMNEEVVLPNKEKLQKKEKQLEEMEGKRGEKKDDKERKKTKKRDEKKVKSGKMKRELNERDLKEKISKSQYRGSVYNSKIERVKKTEKTNKRKLNNADSQDPIKKARRRFEEEKGKTKKHSKIRKQIVKGGVNSEIKIGKRKRRTVNLLKEYWPKKGKQEVWSESEFVNSRFYPKEEFHMGGGVLDGKFINFTGDWFFRLSEGRDEFRRQKILSDWQFERAKARMAWRNDDRFNTNWQFLRALAREDGRMEKLSNSRK